MDQTARRLIIALLLVSAVVADTALGATVEKDSALLSWRRDGEVHWHTLDHRPAVAPEVVPLGSLWKLFVYAYLADIGQQEAPYRCAPTLRRPGSEDDYCCKPGGSITRDEALVRSCGPYFAPERLGITNLDWRRYWQKKLITGSEAAWLSDLSRLIPASEISPAALLVALDTVPPSARRQARAALLKVLLDGYGRDVWPTLGTSFRFKTFSWHQPAHQEQRLGGGAGWLADGTAVWFAAPGTSRNVLTQHAPAILAALPPLRADFMDEEDSPCVEVQFFTRYPIRRVLDSQGKDAVTGNLGGRVLIEFENGNRLPVDSSYRLELLQESGRPVIRGRFTLDEYVARVIDREGNGEPTEAARALAVAARSYVVQQGSRLSGCWAIADSSRSQRVGPNPPSAAALAAARFTEGLVIAEPVHYHRDRDAKGLLNWKRTVERSRQGARFDFLLGEAFGPASFAALNSSSDCERLSQAENWLAGQVPVWQRELRRHPGYEAPSPIAVCALAHGQPYSDQRRGRIYVRDWMSEQGRLTLAHEYIHLAFRFHPNGEDEVFVERTARRLNEVTQ